ncbi:MAG: glycosyltransferase [Planctomycetota bacterium]
MKPLDGLRQAAIHTRTVLTKPLRRQRMRRLCNSLAAPLSVLFYHRVADEFPNDWTISCHEFERHVEYCRDHFELISLDEVQRRLKLGISHEPTVTFTFDDGYADNCHFALPLLIRHRIPCTYFVSTDHIAGGRPFEHDVDHGIPLPVNTIDQLKAAADGGIEIGLHTANHVDFASDHSTDTLKQEIADAKESLETMIGGPVHHFAVPFGMPPQMRVSVFEAAEACGLHGVCSAYGASNRIGQDPFHIKRIHGDPQFARLRNWLTLDTRKWTREPVVPTHQWTPQHRPKRVCFIITSMPVGGAETLLVNMMRAMDTSKVSPEVICLKERGPLGDLIADEFPVHSNVIGSKWDIDVVRRLANRLIDRRADAVVTVGAGDKMFWGRLAARLAGVPKIISALHSTGWPDGVGKLNRLLTPITDAFVGVAESHGTFLQDFEGFPAEKVHVIRNGVDCDRFRFESTARRDLAIELDIPETAPLIGIVAALRPEKNHSLLLEALAALRETLPNLQALIIGDGPERPAIESRIAEMGLDNRVHLLGNRTDTPRCLSALDAFVLCSLNEASPVSILESLACQTPVIATDVGSVRETVIDGQTGWLVPSGDATALSSAIAEAILDRDRSMAMGRAGRELVLKTGSLAAMVRGYENLICGDDPSENSPPCPINASKIDQRIETVTVPDAPCLSTTASS